MSDPLEILVERDQLQRILRLEEQTILVGRGLTCAVRLEDPMASREHCRLERHEDEVQLVDLNSSNSLDKLGYFPVSIFKESILLDSPFFLQ